MVVLSVHLLLSSLLLLVVVVVVVIVVVVVVVAVVVIVVVLLLVSRLAVSRFAVLIKIAGNCPERLFRSTNKGNPI